MKIYIQGDVYPMSNNAIRFMAADKGIKGTLPYLAAQLIDSGFIYRLDGGFYDATKFHVCRQCSYLVPDDIDDWDYSRAEGLKTHHDSCEWRLSQEETFEPSSKHEIRDDYYRDIAANLERINNYMSKL